MRVLNARQRRIKHKKENRESRVDQELRSNTGPSNGHEQDPEERVRESIASWGY